MNVHLVSGTARPVLECVSGLERADDALELIVSCREHGTRRLLLPSQAFPPAFFDLRSGFAGEFVQKLVNYHLRVGAVFETEEGYSGRFREYLSEARRGQQFRVFDTRTEAIGWLTSA